MLQYLITNRNLVLFLIIGFTTISCGAKDPQAKIKELEKEVQELKSLIKNSNTSGKSMSGGHSISQVVKIVAPSVVAVHAAKIVKVNPYQYFNPFEDFFFGNPHRRKQEPKEHKQQGLGSGVIIDKEGHVITNHHVAGEADEIKVTLTDDREFEAEIIGSDKLSDVALLKIKNPPKDLPIVHLGNSDEIEVGETVVAIGSPFGYSNTVTAGILSAKGRRVGINSYENYLQTDASINPGNSGGALVNLDGKLVGINTAIASRSGASHGIGFAIPINMAKSIMDDLLDNGAVVRGYLGIYLQDLDQNLGDALGLKDGKGALITSVMEDSPAEKGGLKAGDVVIKADGEAIKDVNHLRNLVAMLKPDKKYTFVVARDNEKKKLKIKIGKRDDETAEGSKDEDSDKSIGLTLENITPAHVQRYSLSTESGVIVSDVKAGSKGEKAGFMIGDIILTINRKKIKTASEFKKAVKKLKKGTALVVIERRGMKQYLGLKVK